MLRILVWSGASAFSMMTFCMSRSSRVTRGPKRTRAVFGDEANSSGCVETYLTSAWREATQYPSSPKGCCECGVAHHHSREVRRSSANSSNGIRSSYRSGSVKSRSSGIAGVVGTDMRAPPLPRVLTGCQMSVEGHGNNVF